MYPKGPTYPVMGNPKISPIYSGYLWLTQPMDPEKKSLNFIFPTKYVIPKSLKFSHWPSKMGCKEHNK